MHDAFLAEICEHPDDDVPRLVYADWLADNGDPDRGDFIRVQCELARLAEDDPGRPALQEREGNLLGHHAHRWWGEVPEWARRLTVLGPDRAFRRGFFWEVVLEPRRFLDHGEELCRRFPIQSVELRGLLPVRALTRHPRLGQLRRLALAETALRAVDLEALVAVKALRLLSLELPGLGLGDDEAEA